MWPTADRHSGGLNGRKCGGDHTHVQVGGNGLNVTWGDCSFRLVRFLWAGPVNLFFH
jgi:hypothetical protein